VPALATCSNLYLERTLKVAGEKVVIALGKMAREGIASYVGGTSEVGLQLGQVVGGRKRAVLMLGHPSGFHDRKKPTDAEKRRLQALLLER
jgi:hypothetical protein